MASALARAKQAIADGRWHDHVAFMAPARELAQACGTARAEASTFRAIYAVLRRPEHGSDSQAQQAYGAKKSTFQQWKKNIQDLETQATADSFVNQGYALLARMVPALRQMAIGSPASHQMEGGGQGTLICCTACGEEKPKADFSRNQLAKKSRGQPYRCLQCIAIAQDSTRGVTDGSTTSAGNATSAPAIPHISFWEESVQDYLKLMHYDGEGYDEHFRKRMGVIIASERGLSVELQSLIGLGYDVDFVHFFNHYGDGTTPLIQAVNFGHPECARILLAAGASVYRRSPDGATAIDVAQGKDDEIMLALLEGKRNDLLAKALSKGLLYLSFKKDNGEDRKMLCTRNLDLIPYNEQPKDLARHAVFQKKGAVSVYEIESGWKSFHLNTIKDIFLATDDDTRRVLAERQRRDNEDFKQQVNPDGALGDIEFTGDFGRMLREPGWLDI